MKKPYVNLTVNPCKMCKPMGGATAFMGIEGCMTILHGSQGCSTYIRRHMATHYNEPIDIASSSLTEHGTVYGGEKNLIQGIKNLIKLYSPKAVGIMTTCLAETIGEDIVRIISKIDENDLNSARLITSSTAGYSGTHTDGFESTVKAIVEQLAKNTEKNNKLNVVACEMSPADIRHIKEILGLFGADYILLPDISENLDKPYKNEYERTPKGGTKLTDIEKMAGAAHTISFGLFTEEKNSAAFYLYEKFGIPYTICPMPCGLENTDIFIRALKKITGKEIPAVLREQRGRLLDAMIDSHKYCAHARAAVFGEPELVYGIISLCAENGIMPLISATGRRCKKFKQTITEKIEPLAKFKFQESYFVSDNCDFAEIERQADIFTPNILIGSSDGRRIEEKKDIPLLRTGFPIHDRAGGQRQLKTGYLGTLNLIDSAVNIILESVEKTYRKFNKDSYFTPQEEPQEEQKMYSGDCAENKKLTAEEKTKLHPCFNCGASDKARIHLPIAPSCNISCNYCLRKFDCANESRPGVSSEILNPEEAVLRYMAVKEKLPELTVVGIAGPGDSLANFDQVEKTLKAIRNFDKDVIFCLSTNGLMLPWYARSLVELGVSHVTVTVNAVDPKIGAKIYKTVNYLGKVYQGTAGAEILLKNQQEGIKFLAAAGVTVKVNIVVLAGVNDAHIEKVVKTVKALGAEITNIMQLIPVNGTPFEGLPLVPMADINKLRVSMKKHLPQMFHCRQCRADAVGRLSEDLSLAFSGCGKKETEKTKQTRELFAVASKNGFLIDTHFGMAEEFYIYSVEDGKCEFECKRMVDKYCTDAEDCGKKTDKIQNIINTIKDCTAVLCTRVGSAPSQKLKDAGIKIYELYDTIDGGLKKAASYNEKTSETENIRKIV